MKTRLVLFLALMFLQGCMPKCGKSEVSAPEQIAGRTLHATMSQGTGAFAEMPIGYTFDAKFNEDMSFTTMSSEKKLDSQGTYKYSLKEPNVGLLVLTDNSELHKGESIEVSLTFTGPNLGTYKVRVLNRQADEQNGTFELR